MSQKNITTIGHHYYTNKIQDCKLKVSSGTNRLGTEEHWLRCMKKSKNASQVQHVEESQWPTHVGRLWTNIINNKK